MSDDKHSEQPKKGYDISEIGALPDSVVPTSPGHAATQALNNLARADEAIKSAMPSIAIQDALKLTAGNQVMDEIRRASFPTDEITKALRQPREFQEALSALTGQFELESSIGRIARQIEDQYRSIDALRLNSPPLDNDPAFVPDLHIPPNPIHETNDRLGRIEKRFEQMLDVAANGAEIATGLQAHAAQFLVKFENAASDNDRSASRAIHLGVIAVVIAIAMPIVQTAYTELWRVPQDSASMEAVVADMEAEIATLRQTQIQAADRIAAAVERSDEQMVNVLQEVARSLKVMSSTPVSGKDTGSSK